MNTLPRRAHLWTAAVLCLGLLLGIHSAIAADPSTTQSSGQATAQGYGPGMMGPGMMYNWTPEQRQKHWEWMRRRGYGPGMTGPGMMYGSPPGQRQQSWTRMRPMMGYGPGTMMGSPPASPSTSGQ